MLISHEMPLDLLRKGFDTAYNDYFYALCHLFETEPYYLEYTKKQLQDGHGRKVILDNSLFELKKAFDLDRFAYWIKEVRPTEYIIPDSWCNASETVQNVHKFIQKYPHLPGKSVAVVQGTTPEELISCYQAVEPLVSKVAFSFDNPGFAYFYPRKNKWVANMKGRHKLLTMMLKKGIINTEKPHHLLGCMLPQDFQQYKGKKWRWIESIDTSNPIIHGYKGERYSISGKLKKKSDIKLVDILHVEFNRLQIIDTLWNLMYFRNNLS